MLVIPHHLLYHPPRLGVQVRKGRRSRVDLGGVNSWVVGEDVRPPLRSADMESFGKGSGGLVDRCALRDEANNLREFVELNS